MPHIKPTFHWELTKFSNKWELTDTGIKWLEEIKKTPGLKLLNKYELTTNQNWPNALQLSKGFGNRVEYSFGMDTYVSLVFHPDKKLCDISVSADGGMTVLPIKSEGGITHLSKTEQETIQYVRNLIFRLLATNILALPETKEKQNEN